MRYVAMQVLTWGTIVGAIGSALLLAALDSTSQKYFAAIPLEASLRLPSESGLAGRRHHGRAPSASPTDNNAASAANVAGR
jgi:hypothetical protein